jgi:hypothetical protein
VFPGDPNWKVGPRRPAESVRQQQYATVSTLVFRFDTFVVVHDLHAQLCFAVVDGRDPDGYLIEVGQYTKIALDWFNNRSQF